MWPSGARALGAELCCWAGRRGMRSVGNDMLEGSRRGGGTVASRSKLGLIIVASKRLTLSTKRFPDWKGVWANPRFVSCGCGALLELRRFASCESRRLRYSFRRRPIPRCSWLSMASTFCQTRSDSESPSEVVCTSMASIFRHKRSVSVSVSADCEVARISFWCAAWRLAADCCAVDGRR